MPPTKAQKKQAQAAAEAFDAHFAQEYGTRWPVLRERLAQPTEYAALVNAYAPAADVDRALLGAGAPGAMTLFRLPVLPGTRAATRLLCLTRAAPASTRTAKPFPPPRPAAAADAAQRLHTHWNLDAASVLAAHLLDAQPGHAVLDLCAAPGGKSIALAQRLWPELYADRPNAAPAQQPSMLHANEIDVARNRRLVTNLQSYLPRILFDRGLVEVTRVDGTAPRAVHLFPLGEGAYDRVLLDAPCSSERHVLHAQVRAQQSGTIAPEMMAWKPAATRTFSKTQGALLHTAWHAVRPGGRVLYATCSLSHVENDEVVRAFLDGAADAHVVRVDDAVARVCERTDFGYLALPDHLPPGASAPAPWGPLYFCVLKKGSP